MTSLVSCFLTTRADGVFTISGRSLRLADRCRNELEEDRWNRALTKEDTDGIVSLYDACSQVEDELGPITAAQWLNFVSRPRFAEGRDFRVALKGGQIVGLVESTLRNQSDRRVRYIKIIVDPSYRRAHIGTSLLTAVLEQDRDDDVSIHGHVRKEWTSGKEFCQRRSFVVIESEFQMYLDKMNSTSNYTGLAIISVLFDIESHATRLAQIHNNAFRDDVSYTPHTPEDMISKAKDCRTWIAVMDGEIVAHALIEHDSNRIWLESIAVDPKFQGRGIGTALVVQGLRGRQSADTRPTGLSISSKNPQALHIYEKLGFKVRSEKLRFAARRSDLLYALRPATRVLDQRPS